MQNQIMKLLSFSLIMFCLTSLSAQEVESQKRQTKKRTEIGLTYELGKGFSLLLKQQLKDKLFLRSTISGSMIGRNLHDFYNFNLRGSLGLEFHIPLNDRLSLYHGPEISARYHQYSSGDTQITTQSLGIGYFSGVIFNVTDRFSIFGEVSHTLFASHSRSHDSPLTSRSNVYSGFNTDLKIGATFNLKNNNKNKEKFRF